MNKLTLAALLCTAASPLAAQWDSIPKHPTNPVRKGANLITHTNSTGIQAFSSVTQKWTTVSPPGSTFQGWGDSFVLTEEASGSLRAWSARHNASAVLTPGAAYSVLGGGEVVLVTVLSSPAGTVFHAYSAMTNAWSSLTIGFQLSASTVSKFAAGVREGNRYHAFSAYTGQWSTLTVTAPGALPQSLDNVVTADLFSAGVGVRQIAAYSAIRGTWALSPLYPSASGASAQLRNNLAIAKVALPSALQYSYAGFSASTGQWATSPLVHSTTSTVSANSSYNVAVVTDSDPNARFEVFGAGTGTWLARTGPNLVPGGIHEDYASVSDTATQTLYATSGLVGGGWAALTGGYNLTSGDHVGLCTASNPPGYKAYSAATNTFTPSSLSVPPLNASSAIGTGVIGIVGSGNYTAQAFSTRSGGWVPGPVITASETYSAVALGSTLVAFQTAGPNAYALHVFDEHRGAWQAPFQLPPSYTLATGANYILAYPGTGSGPIYAFSAQRGAWSTLTGAGDYLADGGFGGANSNVFSFADSNGLLWAFSTTERVQTTAQWPLSREYASSGPGPVGSAVPSLAFSVRGQPSAELALVYAAFTLWTTPVAIPGLSGLLDIDPATAFPLVNLGVFDADGVMAAAIPLASAIPGGIQVWMQAITLDLTTLQLGFAGRATGTRIF